MIANKTFVIRHKETKELWQAPSGKSSWRAIGHAKCAWSNLRAWHCARWGLTPIIEERSWGNRERAPLFHEQDVYEVVELKAASEARLQRAEELLRFCVGRLHDTYFEEQVKQFLEEKSE